MLRARGDEYLIIAGGRDLMSSRDEASSRALASLGCAGLRPDARVLVGGLGLGFTTAEALAQLGAGAVVETAELVPCVAQWSRELVGHLAGHPLEDPRAVLRMEDVALAIGGAKSVYDAILLDVDNGAEALAHEANDALCAPAGLRAAHRALRPGGTLAVWMFDEDRAFERRLRAAGFEARTEQVQGAAGRGRFHYVAVGRRKDSPTR